MAAATGELFAHKVRRKLGDLAWRWQCRRSPEEQLYRFGLGAGLKFDYPLRSEIARTMFLFNRFESGELKFVSRFLRPGMTFVDAGANGGLYTLLGAEAVGPAGRVHAFEPGQAEFALLQHNLELNGLRNVNAQPLALGDRIGEVQLAVCEDGAYNSLGKNNLAGQRILGWRSVPVTTLDAYLKENEPGPVHLLKIDTEGAELTVLRGARDLLSAADAPVVLCEFSDLTTAGLGYATAELWAFFTGLGFRLYQPDASGRAWIPAVQKAAYVYENLVAARDPALLAKV